MFSGPNSIGFVWSQVGQVLEQFMQFSVFFRMLAFLVNLLTLLRRFQVVQVGML